MYEKIIKEEKEYNIVLLGKPIDEGLSIDEVVCMYRMLSSTEALPVDIQVRDGYCIRVLGFIAQYDAELMSYDYSLLEGKVKEIIGDMGKEHLRREYEIEHKDGISTMFISRRLDPDAYRGLPDWASDVLSQ